MISFRVDGQPVAQPRPKVSTRGGFARAYVNRKHPVHAWREAVAVAALEAGAKPIDGPIRLYLSFVMRRPKDKTRKRGVQPSAPHDRRPDADNLTKAVTDALDGVAWVDDAQVCELIVSKRWAATYEGAPETPGAEVEIDPL